MLSSASVEETDHILPLLEHSDSKATVTHRLLGGPQTRAVVKQIVL
jgi:hypothetical protein